MKKLKKVAGISLVLSGIIALALPTMSFAAPPALPKGKPFQYLNSRIDSLQAQLNILVGRADSLEAWQVKAELALLQLQKDSVLNAAAIALLGSEIEKVNLILETKQDIIDGTCPDKQFVYKITKSPASLVCRAGTVASGLVVLTVENTNQIAAQSAAITSAQCPTGSVVTGGSFDASPALTVNSAGIVGNGYQVNVANISDAIQTLNITATCLAIK